MISRLIQYLLVFSLFFRSPDCVFAASYVFLFLCTLTRLYFCFPTFHISMILFCASSYPYRHSSITSSSKGCLLLTILFFHDYLLRNVIFFRIGVLRCMSFYCFRHVLLVSSNFPSVGFSITSSCHFCWSSHTINEYSSALL